jgi:aminoglycoside phosphotransferase (APT) family kinase protein
VEPSEALTELVEAVDPSARLVRAERLRGGLSNVMTLLEVDIDGVRVRWVARRRRRAEPDVDRLADEVALLRVLAATEIRVPRVLHFDGTTAVFEFIDAEVCLDRDFGASAAETMAETLAAIHSVDIGLELPRNAAYLGGIVGSVPEVLDDAAREGEIRDALRGMELPDPVDAGFVHGDFWSGNLLWRGDEIAAVLDWESAALGDPLADVACTRLDILLGFGADAMERFTERYRALRPFRDDDRQVWDLVAALRPCGQLAHWASDNANLGRPDLDEAALRAAHADFTTAALAH